LYYLTKISFQPYTVRDYLDVYYQLVSILFRVYLIRLQAVYISVYHLASRSCKILTESFGKPDTDITNNTQLVYLDSAPPHKYED
jgi:hypothetical protein